MSRGLKYVTDPSAPEYRFYVAAERYVDLRLKYREDYEYLRDDLLCAAYVGAAVGLKKVNKKNRFWQQSQYVLYFVRKEVNRTLWEISRPVSLKYNSIKYHYAAAKKVEKNGKILNTFLKALEPAVSDKALYCLEAEDRDVHRRAEIADVRGLLAKAMGTLSLREQRFMRLYYGFDGVERNMYEIGGQEGISPQMVSLVLKRALRKMQHPARLRWSGLTDYYENEHQRLQKDY